MPQPESNSENNALWVDFGLEAPVDARNPLIRVYSGGKPA